MRKNTIITILLVALIGLSGCAGILGGGDGAGTKTNTTSGTPEASTDAQPTQEQVINQTVQKLGETTSVSYSWTTNITANGGDLVYNSENNGSLTTEGSEFMSSSEFESQLSEQSEPVSETFYRNSTYSFRKITRPEYKTQIDLSQTDGATNISEPLKYEVDGRVITDATVHNAVFTNNSIETATFRNESTEFTVSDVPEEEFYFYVFSGSGRWTVRESQIDTWNKSQMGTHRDILQLADKESITYRYNGGTATVNVTIPWENVSQLYATTTGPNPALGRVNASKQVTISYRINSSDYTIERAVITADLLYTVRGENRPVTTRMVIQYDQYDSSSVTIPPAARESAELAQP